MNNPRRITPPRRMPLTLSGWLAVMIFITGIAIGALTREITSGLAGQIF